MPPAAHARKADGETGLVAGRFLDSFKGQFEENMTVCVESLIGEEGGAECIKLETQVLITDQGAVRLDTFPWENV